MASVNSPNVCPCCHLLARCGTPGGKFFAADCDCVEVGSHPAGTFYFSKFKKKLGINTWRVNTISFAYLFSYHGLHPHRLHEHGECLSTDIAHLRTSDCMWSGLKVFMKKNVFITMACIIHNCKNIYTTTASSGDSSSSGSK